MTITTAIVMTVVLGLFGAVAVFAVWTFARNPWSEGGRDWADWVMLVASVLAVLFCVAVVVAFWVDVGA